MDTNYPLETLLCKIINVHVLSAIMGYSYFQNFFSYLVTTRKWKLPIVTKMHLTN